MPKITIKSLIAEAIEYKTANPETPLTVFEICMLMQVGVTTSPRSARAAPQEPRGMDEFRAAYSDMGGPFTAEEFATVALKKYLKAGRPNRLQVRAAGRAARILTGCEPRKTNGREVYDPA